MHALLILPGMDGSGLMHEAFITALGPDVAVTSVRYPDQEALGYEQLARIASAGLPEAGDVFVLGESFSGPLAVRLAAAHPGRVRGVILCGSFVCSPRPGLGWLRLVVRGVSFLGPLLSVAAPVLLGKAASPALRRMLAEVLSRIPPAVLAARLRAAMRVDVSAPFATLQCPILYLRAAHDRIVPPRAAEEAARLNPRTRIVEISASHFMLQTAPAETARAVSAFLHAAQAEGG
jgi:pimeloyl-[acyl-carrier protein] methyl ester esterase